MAINPVEQLEIYRHRCGSDHFHLSKVNAEIIYYLDKAGYLDVSFYGITNYKDKIFRALASNDHRIRQAYGKDLLQALWEIEFGLGCYPFAEVLSHFEFAGKFYLQYRDHVLHQLRVYLLGLYLFRGCGKINKIISEKYPPDKFSILWKIAALSHDHGYIFEVDEAERDPWVRNRVLPVFHNSVGFPFSCLTESVRKNRFEKSISPDHDKLLEALKSRGFSHTFEKSLHKKFEILPPIIDTINDLLSFKGKSLMDKFSLISQKARLSKPNVNGVDAYYQFASKYGIYKTRKGFLDHGVTSALLLLLQGAYHEYLTDKLTAFSVSDLKAQGLSNENITTIKQFKKFTKAYHKILEETAEAVAIHNISPDFWKTSGIDLTIAENTFGLTLQDFKISHESMPLSFLLALVDTLQDWDRPLYSVPSTDEISNYQSEQDISITLDDDHIYLAFPNKKNLTFDPFQKVLNELKSRFDPNFIGELIKEKSWKAVGIIKMTSEAEEIERPIKFKSEHLSADKLKELFSLKKKCDHFAYTLVLDISKYDHFLILVRDLVAFANTNGGYYVVGIDPITFELVGLDKKTKIPEDLDYLDSINLFCSHPINVIGAQRKVLVTSHGKKTFKQFYTFYVEKSPVLISMVKDGIPKDTQNEYFVKNSIPIRFEGHTIIAEKSYVLERFKEAQLYNDSKMIASIVELYQNNKLSEVFKKDIGKKPVPSVLPTPDFERLIGRDKEITDVIDLLNNPKVYSLTIDGIGGCGKSALALEIAKNIQTHSYKSELNPVHLTVDFDGIVWVSAKTSRLSEKGITTIFSSPVTLDILLDNIAETLGFTELKELSFDEKKSRVIELLNISQILLVIDNLETIPDSQKKEIIDFVEKELPIPSKTIFTTRTKFHGGYGFRVTELSLDNATKLGKDLAFEYRNFTLAKNIALVRRICERTGRIPLGIKWIVARLCMGYNDFKTIDNIADDRDLLKFCFDETFFHLTEVEKYVLFVIAYGEVIFDIDHIELITTMPRREIVDILKRLESFSLVKLEDDKINILPLTKDYAIFTVEGDTALSTEIRKKVEGLYQLDDTLGEGLPAAKKKAAKSFKQAEMEVSRGNFLTGKKKLEEALNWSREDFILKALAEINERLGEDRDALACYEQYVTLHPEDITILKKLAFYYKSRSNKELALQYFTKIAELSPDDRDVWHYKGLLERGLALECSVSSAIGGRYLNEAIKSFQLAIQEPATSRYESHINAINYHLLTKSYLAKQDIRKARDACLLGLKNEPNNSELGVMALQYKFR